MTSSGRISKSEAERVLSGAYVAPGEPGTSRDLTAFAAAVRSAVPELPDPGLETSLVPRLADAAASAAHGASLETTVPMARVVAGDRPSAWRRRLVVLAAAVASLPVLMAGLAYASVRLPDAVDQAFDAVGVGLPNQSEADDSDGDGDANPNRASQRGSDHGAASEANAADARPGPSERASARAKARAHTHALGPSGATPPGHGGVAPGQGGVPPGNGGVPPGGGSDGSTGPPPSADPPLTTPGDGATPPGRAGTPPGQTD